MSWFWNNVGIRKKNEGQVKAGVTKAGKLNPKEGFFNFAVPSIKTIIRQQKKIDKFMYAGIINGSFDLVNNMKEYVLEYDAKRIASGLGENEIGDVNLWGYEGPPSLQEAKEQLQEEIEIVDKISCMSNIKNSESLPLLGTLFNNITYRIKKKRYSILGHEKYLHEVTKMCVGNPRIAKKYNKSIQDTKGSIYLLQNWINDALQLNKEICYIMSEINGSNHLFECSNISDLDNKYNV